MSFQLFFTDSKQKHYMESNQAGQDERIAKMTFTSVYPHYVSKVEKKDRTKEELHTVIEWLTGHDENKIQQLISRKATFKGFFKQAPLNGKNLRV